MTDTEVQKWMEDKRKQYAAGTLPLWQRDAIERIPGWHWGCEPGPLTKAAKQEDILVRVATNK